MTKIKIVSIALIFYFVALEVRAKESLLEPNKIYPIRFKIEKSMMISSAVEQFNKSGGKWLQSNNVPLLDDIEVSNALALGSDSLLEKPSLEKLARSSYNEGLLPEGSVLLLRAESQMGTTQENAYDVPFVYIYLYITTLKANERHEGVPAPEELAKGACIPVRLTKRPSLRKEPEHKPVKK